MIRAQAVLVAMLMALAAMAVPAAAQYPPEEEAAVTVSATVVVPGGTITVVGEEFAPATQATVTLVETTEVLGTVTVRADGTFSVTVTVPADLSPGTYTLRVSGTGAGGEARVFETQFTVVAAAAAPAAAPGRGLAATGGQFTVTSALAALLFVVGGGALFASRRLRKVSV